MAKKIKSYSETELIDMFGLTLIVYQILMTVQIEKTCFKLLLFYVNSKTFWKLNCFPRLPQNKDHCLQMSLQMRLKTGIEIFCASNNIRNY